MDHFSGALKSQKQTFNSKGTHLESGALDSPSENVPLSHKYDSNLLQNTRCRCSSVIVKGYFKHSIVQS